MGFSPFRSTTLHQVQFTQPTSCFSGISIIFSGIPGNYFGCYLWFELCCGVFRAWHPQHLVLATCDRWKATYPWSWMSTPLGFSNIDNRYIDSTREERWAAQRTVFSDESQEKHEIMKWVQKHIGHMGSFVASLSFNWLVVWLPSILFSH